MYNIAVIGVGALGRRHVESILKSEMELQVYVIDNNRTAVENIIAMDEKIVGGTNISILPQKVDVAIIATSSAVRKDVFMNLISHSDVKNIIFEKVLFQRVEDYYEVKECLCKKNIRAWVNCARREFDSYWKIKEILQGCNNFTVNISGRLNGDSDVMEYTCWI